MAAEQCTGYEFDTKDNKVLYECPICKNIIRKFTELPCEHATCKKCLVDWERQRFQTFQQIGER